ncbi:hypothetical protein MCAMS1_01585 [biofilm metagenome]
MKLATVRILLALLISFLAGCYPNQTSFFSSASSPGKEILINNEQYDRPHVILGPVEYTLRKNTSLFVNQIELRNQAIDLLKQSAYARYGQKVDAIEAVKVSESNVADRLNQTQNVTQVKGIAIAFLSETKPYVKSKNRAKTARSPARKTKPSNGVANKENSEDITITPSEILK